MTVISCKYFLSLLVLVFLFKINAAQDLNDKHINVAMRLIGFEAMVNENDSSVIVLPIEKDNHEYVIGVNKDFEFTTDSLINKVDSILSELKIANHYIVEVKTCDSSQVVYSYEFDKTKLPEDMNLINSNEAFGIIPCGGRFYPKDCYKIHLTVLNYFDEAKFDANADNDKVYLSNSGKLSYAWAIAFVVLIVLIIIIFLYYRKKKGLEYRDENKVKIGEHIFDSRNMELTFKNAKIDLTHKESELLLLLHKSVNNTVEKEVMLKEVWGDEGDYVGRTLDVFISKLRKKMESDSLVKIINVRGVGYKLVVNDG